MSATMTGVQPGSLWAATMPDERRVVAARRSTATSTSTWPSSAPATPGCGRRCYLAERRPGAAHRRARARARRLRRQRPQRRLVLGAAGDEPAPRSPTGTAATRRSPCSGRCTRPSTRSAGARRGRRRRRASSRAARSRSPAPRPSDAPPRRRRRRGPGVRVRRRRPALARRRRARRSVPGDRHARRRCSRRTARRSTRCASSTPSPRAAIGRGVRLHEHTPVVTIEPRRVTTPRGPRARRRRSCWRPRPTPSALPGRHRDVLPLYSLMVGSEPLTTPAVGRRSGSPAGRRSTTPAT